MKRYILTGTPGSGKTTLLNILSDFGYSIINEAATDIIAVEQAKGVIEPWKRKEFIDSITLLQKERQKEASGEIQFYDRSPLCTLALAKYLNIEPSPLLIEEIQRVRDEKIYQTHVFFIDNLGFCQPTSARTISYEESIKFEKIHEEIYRKLGYTLIRIAVDTTEKRAEIIRNHLNDLPK